MNAETITHTTFKELVEAGAVRGTCAVAFGDRWGLVFSYGGVEKTFRAIFREFCQLGQDHLSRGIAPGARPLPGDDGT